jgi:hypothetical protein
MNGMQFRRDWIEVAAEGDWALHGTVMIYTVY